MTQKSQQGKIFGFNAERDAIVAEVVARNYERLASKESAIELAINETAFHELARLEGTANPALTGWRELYRTLGRRSLEEKQSILKRLIRNAAQDIVGNFDSRVYDFATRVVPYGLSWIFRPQGRLPNVGSSLANRIRLTGHTETLRSLAQRGTVILVPTHSSNLDSLVIGYALFELGLPPFTYGAGKNLFTNFLLSFFMQNLGAYKVDRRLTFSLYKDALKTYSTVLLERGYHSLFFPGGGRGRSNAIESKLKLGLVGTGLAAYINNLKADKEKPDIFVVPATLNYHLVLEAETLMDDQLQKVGRSRYIIEDDESAHAGRIWSFIRQMFKLDTRMVIQFGEPLDCFGNRVTAAGISLDMRGRPIDRRKYVETDGVPEHHAQRDAEYTRELGQAITASYRKNAVALSTHVVAFALFQLAKRQHLHLDIFQLLRLPDDTTVSMPVLHETAERLRTHLRSMAERSEIVLGDQVLTAPIEELVAQALQFFHCYHKKPLAIRQGPNVLLKDLKLLLYYHNRLTGYDLEGVIGQEVAV